MLDNKVVVVTGGAGLLGREFVKTIVQNNGIAVIAEIDIENANKFKEQLLEECQATNIDVVKLDISNKDSIQRAIDYLDNKHQRIDALVNNAYPKNIYYGKPLLEVEYQDFCENVSLHLGGYFLTSQQFAQYFIKHGGGNIVNMSSIYGVMAPKFEIYSDTKMDMPVEYAAIKSGLIHLTKYMAKYFKGMNIRVNTLSPGGVLDNQPSKFLNKYNQQCSTKGMLDVKDLNGTLLYLLSDLSQYVNGQNIIVDDGFTL
jgi:NAD(P)-dependent dehydrogenase (short-subunit alcohol dehydrogenase family)